MYFIGDKVAPPQSALHVHAMNAAAESHHIPFELLCSLAWHESRFNAALVSGDKCGMFQIPRWVGNLHGLDPMNVVEASELAARLLAHWRARYRGSFAHALAAWKIGPDLVEQGPIGSVEWPVAVKRWVLEVLKGADFATPATVPVWFATPDGMERQA